MKLICIGDSFTRGFGVKKKENWVSHTNIDGVEVMNMGINGDTTSGMLARFRDDVISEKPNYVLITGGTNDFISGSDCAIPQNNYMAMVHQAFHSGIIPVVGIEPGFSPENVREDWAVFSDFQKVFDKQMQLGVWLKKMCKTFGVFHIDFYEGLDRVTQNVSEKDMFIDGLHLTADGHKLIAGIVNKELQNIIFGKD